MATVTKNLGIATAYGYAKSKGYTGTEEEFAQAMKDMTDAVDTAQENAENSEAWAVGKRNGTDVPSTDVAYHNNAKYYADQIGSSASQIATNTQDIADLKDDLSDITEVISGATFFDFQANWSQMTVGLINTSDGTIVGDSGTGARVSDYLPVTAGTTYIIKMTNRVAYYSTSKSFISMVPDTYSQPQPWTPAADGYVRLNTVPANVQTAEAVIAGATSAIDLVAREAIGESIEGLEEVIVIAETLFDFQANWSTMTSGLIDTSNGNIVSAGSTGAKVSDYIEVQSGTTYVLSGMNRAAYYNSSKGFIESISGVYYGTEFIPEQDGYVRLNTTPTNLPNSVAKIGISTAIDNIARKDLATIKNELHIEGDCYTKLSGDLSSGASLTVTAVNNIKKNNVYSFSGKITSFSSLQIGHGTTNLYDSYIEITGTNVVVHNRLATDETVTYAHGLNISSYIKVEIQVKDFGITNGYMDCDITVLSGGSAFRQENVKWLGCGKGNIFVKSVGSSLTDCSLTWASKDLKKKIWIFGDSYVMIPEPARWPYYAHRDGFLDNVLLNGMGGGTSALSMEALQGMIEAYGSPKYIVWILGMNDGSDGTGSGTYPTAWFNAMGALLTLCANNGITPVLATIPTVPNIRHEQKNAYVRATGYRCIDFAKAVGASSSGQWYSGMLSNDNTHPTELGAKALYNQVLLDFPEITFE